MSVHLYSCDSGKQRYVRVCAPAVDITYCVGSLGFLSRTIVPQGTILQKVASYPLSQTEEPIVVRVIELFKKIQIDMLKIADHFQWKGIEPGINCFKDFAEKISQVVDDPKYEELDLSGLDLTYLPFQISLFVKTKKLNLSHNQLRILPIDLIRMPFLEEIDISENPIIELPSWCESQMSRVTFISSIFQDNPEDWAIACCDDVIST